MDKKVYKETIDLRQKRNREIVAEIDKLVELYPTQRFTQILLNYVLPRTRDLSLEEGGSIDGQSWESSIYNEEPAVTYARLSKNLKLVEKPDET